MENRRIRGRFFSARSGTTAAAGGSINWLLAAHPHRFFRARLKKKFVTPAN
jgi:ABC-type uncharacterized transport system substrate-binding protein